MKHRLRLNNFFNFSISSNKYLVDYFYLDYFICLWFKCKWTSFFNYSNVSIITLLDFGVGAVVQSSLYKPLSPK